jgi:hypothetical protein
MKTRKQVDDDEGVGSALRVVEQVIGGPLVPKDERKSPAKRKRKNPHAVALSKLGASKGGQARAEKLSDERRAEIARNAAAKRWGKS